MKKINKALLALVLVISLVVVAVWIWQNYMISYIKTGSMEPVYNRGDLVIIKYCKPQDIHVGDVIVFREPQNGDILILHRVVAIKERDGKLFFLTKGDNNPDIDPWGWVDESLIVGILVARIPLAGYLFLVLDEFLARFLLILLIILVALVYMMMGEESKKAIYPVVMAFRRARIRMAIIIILVIVASWVYASSLSNRGYAKLSFSTRFHSTIENDAYVVMRISIDSRISSETSVARIDILLKNDSGGLIGYGVWSINYPFYGNKTFTIAILALGIKPDTSVEIKIVLKDYLRGESYNKILKSSWKEFESEFGGGYEITIYYP